MLCKARWTKKITSAYGLLSLSSISNFAGIVFVLSSLPLGIEIDLNTGCVMMSHVYWECTRGTQRCLWKKNCLHHGRKNSNSPSNGWNQPCFWRTPKSFVPAAKLVTPGTMPFISAPLMSLFAIAASRPWVWQSTTDCTRLIKHCSWTPTAAASPSTSFEPNLLVRACAISTHQYPSLTSPSRAKKAHNTRTQSGSGGSLAWCDGKMKNE